jgi:hypothetical protein
MKILLTDGSGLTARQCATQLSEQGHEVDVLSPDPMCLCRFTRHVWRVHPVPAFRADPWAWLDAALSLYRAGGYDLLFPTQEQVVVLAAAPEQLRAAGVVTAVPSFAALAAVQDKIAAHDTLVRLDLPEPRSSLDAHGWDSFPAFVKDPIGTASGGVRRVANEIELLGAVSVERPTLIQAAVDGPLAMCQSVFDSGRLVAFHANRREREGANGGASHKRSLWLPEAREALARLGADLNWHGALSADVICSPDGIVLIDINPRIVEPGNARRSGVDLVGALVDVALGNHPSEQAPGRTDVATHQLLLALLGAAQDGSGRLGVARELWSAWRARGAYGDSAEELTPRRRDARAVLPIVWVSAATIVCPASYRWFVSSSVANYSLSPEGWDEIRRSVGAPA